MKKCCIFALIGLLMFSSGVVWAGQFGAPEPMANPGKFSVGIGAFYSSEKLKASDDGFLGGADFWQKTRFTTSEGYVQGSFGIVKNWEIFGRLGGAQMFVSDAFNFNSYTDDFKDRWNLYGTLGVKGVVWSSGPFSVGPVFHASYYDRFKDSTAGTIGGNYVNMNYEVSEIWDMNLGVSVQAKFSGVTFFAGPFVYWRNAVSNLEITSGGRFGSDSTRYVSENNVGGFGGVRIPIMKNFAIEVEGQYTNMFSAGALAVYKF